MFANRATRQDFADTRSFQPAWATPGIAGLADNVDAGDAFDQAGAADRALLRLVACAAGATLLLALLAGLR
jgi:hypothetical protein